MAFVRLPGCVVRPGQPWRPMRRCRSSWLLEGLFMLPACLCSLFSVADIHANGLHSAISFPDCIVQSGNTMNASGNLPVHSSEISGAALVPQNGWELWTHFMQSSCSVGLRWQSKLVPADAHTVCSNRISSTHSIPVSFPSAASRLLSSLLPFSTSHLSAPYWYKRNL